MTRVKAKKYLGQHFLNDQQIAQKIVDSLDQSTPLVLEVGPGMGVLTQFLLQRPELELHLTEVDRESVDYLLSHYPQLNTKLKEGDFLREDLNQRFSEPFSLIGNFPYNISSQIFFKVLEYRDQIPQVVGMIQKEVAERLAAPPGKKDYGILSVFLQAYYYIDYLFTVHENVFTPPPKVKSAVIKLVRNERKSLDCDEKLFFRIVKATFNQRRKTIRNSLKVISFDRAAINEHPLLALRPEKLSVDQFVELTRLVQDHPLNTSADS